MRYILQIMVMLGDLLLFAVIVCAILTLKNILNLAGVVMVGFLIYMCLKCWKEQGAFAAWKLSEVKKYLKNAREQGL